MEPTGGWYGRTVAAWLERHGYRVDWLQNVALHDRRKLMIGKQTKTDALDARQIAGLLFERERLGLKGGFLLRAPRNTDAVRMLVRNRARLVESASPVPAPADRDRGRPIPRAQGLLQDERHQLQCPPAPGVVPHSQPRRCRRPCRSSPCRCPPGPCSSAGRSSDGPPAGRADSTGLATDTDAIVNTQEWMLYQLRLLDDQIEQVEAAIGAVLEEGSRGPGQLPSHDHHAAGCSARQHWRHRLLP